MCPLSDCSKSIRLELFHNLRNEPQTDNNTRYIETMFFIFVLIRIPLTLENYVLFPNHKEMTKPAYDNTIWCGICGSPLAEERIVVWNRQACCIILITVWFKEWFRIVWSEMHCLVWNAVNIPTEQWWVWFLEKVKQNKKQTFLWQFFCDLTSQPK